MGKRDSEWRTRVERKEEDYKAGEREGAVEIRGRKERGKEWRRDDTSYSKLNAKLDPRPSFLASLSSLVFLLFSFLLILLSLFINIIF